MGLQPLNEPATNALVWASVILVQVMQSMVLRGSKMKFIGVTVVSLIILWTGCGDQGNSNSELSNENSEGSLNTSVDTSVIRDWTNYMQSSDNGLWEGQPQYANSYNFMGHLYDEESLEIPVYSPFAVCCYSDTIFVTDASTKELVALDTDGSVLWKAGGEGEGPGEFSIVTTLAVSRKYIAVLNIHLNRVELFNRDGSFANSFSITRPQDIVTLNDTTFLVGSTEEQDGDLHILDTSNGIIRSFGQANMQQYDEILRPDLMRLCIGGDGRVGIFNRYEGLLSIYDIETEECIFNGSREYPSEPTPPDRYTADSGESQLVFFPIGGNAFLGPEGMLNVVICNYMDDGSFISDPDYLDFAPVTGIDRYDWDGIYLDSYCLPDSCINFVSVLNNGNRLIGRNFAEGVLCVFEQN